VNILIILTSHDQLGNTGLKTGFWLEELAAPYYVFKDNGATLTLASPLGGLPPLDPKSNDESAKTDDTRRFEADPAAMAALSQTLVLKDVKAEDFDAVFYPGGHGPLWDLAEDTSSQKIIADAMTAGKPLAAVCHAPGVFRHVKGADGRSIIVGKNVTGFSNTEEAAVQLTEIVPFLVEDMLQDVGAVYSKTDDWGVHVVRDGMLVTGQNPASSAEAARQLLNLLK
jgi:putative intracellular protease/amidase